MIRSFPDGVRIPTSAGAGKVAVSDASGNIAWQTLAAAGVATPSDITTAINALVNAAPGTLDTLGEIATQLASDESAATALTTAVAGKLAIASNLSDVASASTARSNLGAASTTHATAHGYAGSDALHPADLGEFFDSNRHTDSLAVTMPWLLGLSNSTGAITSGTEYGVLARVRTAGSATKIRAHFSSAGTSVTDFRATVYDPVGGAFVTSAMSASVHASVPASGPLDITLGTTLSGLTEGQLLVLMIACIASTGPSLRGLGVGSSTTSGRTTALGYKKSYAASGYTAGSFVAPSSSSTIVPFLELVA